MAIDSSKRKPRPYVSEQICLIASEGLTVLHESFFKVKIRAGQDGTNLQSSTLRGKGKKIRGQGYL